jgi:hypothetical protein
MAPCHRLNVEEARPAHARLAVPVHFTYRQLKHLVAAVLGRAGFVSEHCWKTAGKHGLEAKALNDRTEDRTEDCKAGWHCRKHSKPLKLQPGWPLVKQQGAAQVAAVSWC